MFRSKQANGAEFVAKIKGGVRDWRAILIWDRRSNSLRLDSNRNMALSNQDGKGRKIGKNVAFRVFKNQADQFVSINKDKITNFKRGKKCLTPHHYKNKDD